MPKTFCWQIELEGSELARIEWSGPDMVVVLAAARVPADSSQRGSDRVGGHLHGVKLHLVEPQWQGPPALIGRIDEASWASPREGVATSRRGRLVAPSMGNDPICMSLHMALGETLLVRCNSWRVELSAGWKFTPSRAC